MGREDYGMAKIVTISEHFPLLFVLMVQDRERLRSFYDYMD